ncbi:MAG: hypothetical protein RSB91_08065, partial [Clostridia bacterium]
LGKKTRAAKAARVFFQLANNKPDHAYFFENDQKWLDMGIKEEYTRNRKQTGFGLYLNIIYMNARSFL